MALSAKTAVQAFPSSDELWKPRAIYHALIRLAPIWEAIRIPARIVLHPVRRPRWQLIGSPERQHRKTGERRPG
jgi:hypothetical protein